MKKKTLLATVIMITIASSSIAQEDTHLHRLAARILKRLPDKKYTEHALGRGEERNWRAYKHAEAIYAAAYKYQNAWEKIAQDNGWQYFKPSEDLAPLIAAVAFRESSLREVVRLDGGLKLSYVPFDPIKKKVPVADYGVMQVRAPSGPASACGVKGVKDVQRLIESLEFSYDVGACVLTERIAAYAGMYQSSKYHKLKQRTDLDLSFYGFKGERKDTIAAKRARELIVLERYNWGGSDLYDVEPSNGYARRVIREFEFFREELLDDAMYAM